MAREEGDKEEEDDESSEKVSRAYESFSLPLVVPLSSSSPLILTQNCGKPRDSASLTVFAGLEKSTLRRSQ